MKKTIAALLVVLAGCFGYLYQHVIAKLVHDWYIDENYSHGFLIVPIALYFVWERRKRLREAIQEPSLWGILVVLGSMAIAVGGDSGIGAVSDADFDSGDYRGRHLIPLWMESSQDPAAADCVSDFDDSYSGDHL